MKKFIMFLMVMIFATCAYAENDNTTSESINSSVNNNYLTIGGGGDGTTATVSSQQTESDAKINTHLIPMSIPVTITQDYTGPVFKDHKWQKDILDFLLKNEGPEMFTVVRPMPFVIKTTHSIKYSLADGFDEQKQVYVFKNEDDVKLKNYRVVGYVTSYSTGKGTLMECFDQAVFDSGMLGGNGLILLRVDFLSETKSSTVGLGSSVASGVLTGGSAASVGGAAIGYAASTAGPNTKPYIHGIAIYSEELSPKGNTTKEAVSPTEDDWSPYEE